MQWPCKPQRKPRGVMDDSREKETGGGEWEKSESMAVSSLMWCLWGLHELTINSLCRFPEWGIETNCLLAIQLHSSAPRDKKKKNKKRRKPWLWGWITHKACFWNISFLFCRHRPQWEGHHTLACTHSHLHATQWSDHFWKSRHLPKQSHFKIVIFQQLFLLQTV